MSERIGLEGDRQVDARSEGANVTADPGVIATQVQRDVVEDQKAQRSARPATQIRIRLLTGRGVQTVR